VIQAVKTTSSEADMQTTISGQHGTHLPIAEALWILAGNHLVDRLRGRFDPIGSRIRDRDHDHGLVDLSQS
jgi:hypothetical protein